jgi:hypothetical protein
MSDLLICDLVSAKQTSKEKGRQLPVNLRLILLLLVVERAELSGGLDILDP